MKLNDSGSCHDCKHFTDSIGQNGYCLLYRHNITTPDKCSKYEYIDIKQTDSMDIESKGSVQNLHKNDADRKNTLERLLLGASVLSCSIFTVIAIFFAVIIGTTLMSFDSADFTMRIVLLVTVCLFLLSALVISFMLVHRFVVMRIVYFVFSLLSVAFMLINDSLLWFNFHDLTLNLLETIFNIAY